LAGRGLERRPNHSAGGPPGRLAAHRRKKRNAVLVRIKRAHLQLTDISIYFVKRKKKISRFFFFRVPRGVTRWGNGGPLKAVAAPLTPRPRGTNYEALPFILGRV